MTQFPGHLYFYAFENPPLCGGVQKRRSRCNSDKTSLLCLNLKLILSSSTSKGERQMDLSQEHTRWNCRYHIVWAPKYRRKIIYGKYRKEIGAMLRKLCDYKGIEIVEANACIDHIHMCLRIPPKYSVAQIMGYLKGKSSLMIFEQFGNLKYKFGNRHFWCKGYYVSTVGLNEETIKKYIREQEDADKMTDNVKEPENPFKG